MLTDDGLLPDSFLDRLEQTKKLHPNNQPKWHQRFVDKYLRFAIKLSRLKLDQNFERTYKLHNRTEPTSKNRQTTKEPIWSDLLGIFFFYFTIKLMYIVYNQYILDFHLFKLERFDIALKNHQNDGHTSLQQIESTRNQLVIDYEEARKTLKRIGAPYLNVHYVIEHAFIFLAVICYGMYMNFVIYYNFSKPFDFSIIYTVLAPEKLQHSANFVIHNQVNNFIISSRNYNDFLIDKGQSEAVRLQWRHQEFLRRGAKSSGPGDIYLDLRSDDDEDYYEQSIHRDRINIESETNMVVRNHKFLVEQVKLIALSGMLQPFNRHPEWLEKIANIYCWTILTTYCVEIFCLFFVMFLLPYVPFFFEFDFETDPMDLLFQAEISLYSMLWLTSSTLYISFLAMMCLDQGYLVNRLIELIKQCIAGNTYIMKDFISNEDMRVYINPLSRAGRLSLAADRRKSLLRSPVRNSSLTYQSESTTSGPISDNPYCSPTIVKSNLLSPYSDLRSDRVKSTSDCDISPGGIPYDLSDKAINQWLLYTLMHYKIFVKQFKPMLHSFPFYITTIMFIMYWSIVPTRILIAYLDRDRIAASLLVGVINLSLCHIVLLMVCFMHSRCMSIYRHLQSLLAHTIAVDHTVNHQIGRKVYDRHLIWILRKELNHPDRLTEQFTIHLMAGRGRMTFSSLMRYDFWWGVAAIAIVLFDPTAPNAYDVFGGAWKFFSDADRFVDQFFHGNITA